jgi:C_GCAxxG_C_C family probable redox protein
LGDGFVSFTIFWIEGMNPMGERPDHAFYQEVRKMEEIMDETKFDTEGSAMGSCCGGQSTLGAVNLDRGVQDPLVRSRSAATDEKAIRKIAYGHFEAGLHCAEVVSKTVIELFTKESAEHAVRCASGFGGGIAGSRKEACGAFTGGVVALGYILGRDNSDGSLKDCAALIHQFKARFLEVAPSLYCPEILKAFGEAKNPSGCVKLTAQAAAALVGLVNEFASQGGPDITEYFQQAREKKRRGSCPFSS